MSVDAFLGWTNPIHFRYAPKPACIASQRTAFLLSCSTELEKWHQELPPHLCISTASSSVRIPHVFTTHMVYHTAIILLHKPFLDESRQNSFEESSTGYPIPEPSSDPIVVKANVACYEAAKAICAISQKYCEIFGSFRRSPLTATHCNLMAALIFLQRQRRCIEKKKTSFDTCAKVLKELSESWNPAGRLLQNILKLQNSDLASQRPKRKTHGDNSGIAKSGRSMESAVLQPDGSPGTASYNTNPNTASAQIGMTYLRLEDLGVMEIDSATAPYLSSDDLSFAFDSLPSDYSVFMHLSNNPVHWE